MAKKLSNYTLIIVLVGLVLLYLGVQYFGKRTRSDNYREKLVEIDTSKIDKVILTKGKSKVELFKENKDWKVKLKENQTVDAEDNSVENMISSLLTIKPGRIAAKNEEKWKEFQVDTSGTRVEVFEDGDKTLDLVAGKFGMQDQRSFYTYVRLTEDKEVYTANDFIGYSLSTEANNYRNSRLINFNTDSIKSISFTYPGDSSFTISRLVGKKWQINGQAADSAKTAETLSTLSNLTHTGFENDLKPEELKNELFKASITDNKGESETVAAYSHEKGTIIKSSYNPSLFIDKDGELLKKLFPGKQKFL